MPIEFHCEYCGKTVRASDEHAGKRAKCPSCHQPVYVPTPPEALEPLTLEPLDKEFDEQRAKLLQETRELQHRLLHERDPGGEPPARPAPQQRPQDQPSASADVESLIVEYALSMADGELAPAEDLAHRIRKQWAVAEKVLQRLTIDEMPHPALARIPRPVLVGFFKHLREKK